MQQHLTKEQFESGKYGFNGFVRMDGVLTQAATSVSVFADNTVDNLKKGYRKLQSLPGFMCVKGFEYPIALVGGGPSIKEELDNIKNFKGPIIACGSSHDYLVQNNIIPNFCAVCDPDPISVEYLKYANTKTKYLIAYSCDTKIFEHLISKGCDVYAWHCHVDDDELIKQFQQIDQDYLGVSGGCTVGLRSISIAMMMGYTNHHYWGFDSCIGENEAHHAYEFATDQEEIGKLYRIQIGDIKPDDSRTYICAGYQLAQAHHFQTFYFSHHMLFTPTFHGEGMLADFMAFIKRQGVIDELKNNAMRQFQQGSDFILSN